MRRVLPRESFEAMAPLGLTVENAAYVNGESLVSGAADDAIPAFVRCAVGLNLTGYMFDTESLGPMGSHVGGSDKQQAVLYSRWLGKLSAAMRKAGKTVGVTLSDWGLLYEYSLYAKAEVDHIMTMATYCKIVMLSRFVALSVSLTPKVSLLQTTWRRPRPTAASARPSICPRAGPTAPRSGRPGSSCRSSRGCSPA